MRLSGAKEASFHTSRSTVDLSCCQTHSRTSMQAHELTPLMDPELYASARACARALDVREICFFFSW